MTPAQLAQYYVDLLIMEFFGLPLASGTIAAFSSQAIANMIVMKVRDGFALATATGRQLDALGQILGLSRSAPGFAPGTAEFSLPAYGDGAAGNYVGFARYDDNPVPDGHWARYTDSQTQFVMTDGQFAQLMEFVIAARASNYSVKEIADIFYAFFGTLVTLTDNLNMTVTYTHDATNDPGILFALLAYLNLLPAPAGVQVIVVSI